MLAERDKKEYMRYYQKKGQNIPCEFHSIEWGVIISFLFTFCMDNGVALSAVI